MGAFERITKLLILVIFASIVVYCSLWFYKADIIKRSLKNELEQAKNFTYGTLDFGEVNIKGFPFAFKAEILNLKLGLYQAAAIPGGQPQQTIYTMPKVVVISNFEGDKYTIQPQGTIHIVKPNQEHAELTLDNPQLTLEFKNNLLVNTLGLALNPGFLQSLHYQDNGFTVLANKTNQKVVSGKGSAIHLVRDQSPGVHLLNFSANGAFERGDDFERFTGTVLASDNLSFDINIATRLPENLQPTGDITFTVSKALLKMDALDFNVEGSIQGPALMLYGPSSVIDLTFTTTDYPLMLDNMVKNRWTDKASKAGLVRLLPDIAETVDDKKLVVALRHKQGDNNYYLGKLTVPEAQAKFNAYVQEETQKLVPPASATTPETTQ